MTDRQKEPQQNAKAGAFLETYTVKAGDTLSALALKYYEPGVCEKWEVIYTANKALVCDNPNALQPGQELKIPKLD